MTIEEKCNAIEAFCNETLGCEGCPLFSIPAIKDGTENCFTAYGLPINVDRNYAVLFGAEPEETTAENPYWKAIEAISERQRAKGMQTYGQGLEMNPMGIIDRLTYLEEELIDGLFYIEHIKNFLSKEFSTDG